MISCVLCIALVGAFDSVAIRPSDDTTLRLITARDLVQLRDVDGVQISPDGNWVVYQVHQAVPETNGYHGSWFVVGTRPNSVPMRLGGVGDPRWGPSGEWLASEPAWSPDSRSVAYAVYRGGAVQLWLGDRVQRRSRQLTHNPADVRRYWWSNDGTRIFFTVGVTRAARARRAKERADGGVLLDESVLLWHLRFDEPWWHPAGVPVCCADTELFHHWVFDLRTSQERWTTRTEEVAFTPDTSPVPAAFRRNLGDLPGELSPDGRAVAFVADCFPDSTSWFTWFAVYTRTGIEAPIQRSPRYYGNPRDLAWSADGRAVFFFRSRAFAGDGVVLDSIPFEGSQAQDIFSTTDRLTDCSYDRVRRRVACIRENPTMPPEVAVLDIPRRALRTLTALNPEFRHIALSPATRLQWVNQYGDTTWGHLLQPLGYVAGKRYPLIVTTYVSRGFERGGVGDEYPIQVFAAHGFMVLSFERPRTYIPPQRPGIPPGDFETTLKSWSSPMASLEVIVRRLVSEGLVDSVRTGLTGLSNGAEITLFTISHSSVFHAAATSSGSARDPLFYYLSSNTWWREEFARWGVGGLPDDSAAPRWRRLAPALNAGQIEAPLLIQTADDALSEAMQLYTSLRERGKPVEIIIYPDEDHVKHQPAHRLRIYERNIDWFDFWLHGKEDPDPAKTDQYDRWHKLRALHEHGMPQSTAQ